MGTSALMSLGLRAMVANYAALQTAGHNIANANVEGYSRQQAELTTAQGQFTGAGFFGKGVDVKTVARIHDEFLTREAATSRSIAAMDDARLRSLQRLEAAFRPGEQGVGYAAGQFLNAFVDLASRPSDSAARQVALARAGDVADRFATAGAELDQVQAAVTEELKASVEKVNQLARSIAQVNDKIAQLRGLGQPANDLLDERERLLAAMSEHVQVTTIPADDGSVGVFIAGGQRIVLGNQAQALAVVPDAADPSRSALAIDDVSGWRTLDENYLGGGAITGLLQFQNGDLVRGFNDLGQMAAALAGVVNAQQAFGLDLRDPPGAGGPVFDVGTPLVRPAASNQRGAGGNFAADVGLAVVDATQLQASDYDLQAAPGGPAGSWQLTRLADGRVTTVVDGDVVDGFRLQLGAPPPAATDRFLLQPVARAAVDMRRVLHDPRGLAAAAPVTATASPANAGTGSVAALAVVSTALDPTLSAGITFTSASGDYAWELRDRTTNALVASGTGTWSAGTPIALNGFELTLAGVPAAGDGFNVVRTPFPGQNNGNALALVALRDTAFVGRAPLAAGGLGGGQTVTDAYASAMAAVGVSVQGASTAAEISAGVASQAESARSSYAGVNLDEEAAKLLQFQQSYQAAARVLQVAQSIFDSLLEAARG
jgi:flagellar hook-associated protein 1 FlgK